MFNQKLIQKKVNTRSREDIFASKLEAQAQKIKLNKLHSESHSENVSGSKKKSAKKAKKTTVNEKRKFESIKSSNDQYNTSKKVKEVKHSQKENNGNKEMNKNRNKDFKKSKFKRYFQESSIDCPINSSTDDNCEKNTSSIVDNLSSVIQKSIKNNDKEDNDINKKVKGKSDMGYSFMLEESESSGEEEVFEPRLPSSDDEYPGFKESNEKFERKSRENYNKVYNFVNKIKQVDNVVKGPGKSRHQQRKEALAAERETQMMEKKFIVGQVIAEEVINDNKLAVAIFPGKKIYFNGTVHITPLLGSVSILGYTIKADNSRVVSSTASQSLLGMSSQDSQQITPPIEEKLLSAGVSQQFINQLKDYQNATTVLLLSRGDVSSVNFLRTLGCKSMSLPFAADGNWANVLDAELITHDNYKRYALLQESDEWIAVMDKLLLYYKERKSLKVLICGGQRTGKSTLFKYMINSLLNSECSIKDVNCIDLDPGQPEFSMPTTMSCTTISEPLIEPSFSHQVSRDKMKTVVLGTTSPLYVVEEYLSCIKSLVNSNKEDGIPQVVNTMGWTAGMGLDLMLDTLRIIKPSHVIQIHNPQDTRNNFEELLSSDYVRSCQGGMITQTFSEEDLNYDILEVTAVNKYPVNSAPLKGNIIRDFKVLSEFSHLLEDEEKDEMSVDVRVPWSKMALHVCGRQVPKENILQVLNASLVALCRIDPSIIVEPPRSDLPKHILFEELTTHPAECLGWALVRGVDPLTQHLHLLTKLSEEKVLQDVNAIIMTQQYLPLELYMYFSQGEGPYIQNIERKGAGALTLGRRIMPRASTKQIAQFSEKQSSSHQSTPQNREFSTERHSPNKKSKPLEDSNIVTDKDYYDDSWT
ncbi:unnamed protein product [Meganyctiphanes norvegica]|uniref:Polynucleotide 5'-hydroxyl-kinase NOL9 n=1 Tax=Meganyctiphanes norvegica TaxID=48144 RepID=A0AAV2Q931_MEGNR